MALSREQIEHSPSVDTDKPISRQYEEAYARHYGLSLWWAAPEEAAMSTVDRSGERARKLKESERKAGESHLRSSGEVIGYSIQAADGAIGHVGDILVDDRNWAVADLVVDKRDWLPGGKVRVPTSAIESIDWESKEVRVHMRRATSSTHLRPEKRKEPRMKRLVILALLTGVLAPMQVLAQDNANTRERLDTFRSLDANGDGWLTKAEAATRREVAAGFQKADANRDGRLSFAEFETIALNRSDQPGGYRDRERG